MRAALLDRMGRFGRLERNAFALMASSVATGLLGLVYWIAAERFFPTEQVGVAAATISTATLLGSLACLSLGGSYQRFLPLSGARTRSFVLGGLVLTGSVALVLGCGFLLAGPGRERLFATPEQRWVFPALVVVLTGYALLDPILTGIGSARAVAVKNVAHSVLKIAPIPLLGVTGSGLALVGSWVGLALLVGAVSLGWLLRRGIADRAGVPPRLPPAREMWAFQGASLMMAAVLTITPLALPLIVLSELGPEHSAYYNLVASLGTATGLLRAGVLASYVVEASAPDADRDRLTRRMLRLMTVVSLAAATGLAVGGPLLLRVVGEHYAQAATPLVLLLACEALVGGLVAVYGAFAQVVRRLRRFVVVQTSTVIVTVGGAVLLVPLVGLTGVGLAALGAQLVAALLAAPALWRMLRALTRTGRQP